MTCPSTIRVRNAWPCCSLLLAAAVVITCGVTSVDATERPNIVLIMADDLGFSDLGCYGGEIKTPNLDRLAASGLRMTQFYNTAKCETSRRSLMSGLWHPEYESNGEDRNFLTIAERLRAAGYSTWMTGKWHIDGQPLVRGFSRYFGHLSGATDFFHGDNTFRLDDQPFTVPKQGFYTTDANTDYAIEFLEQSRAKDDVEKPFFLYIAYNAPHYPLQAPKEDIEKYRGRYLAGWDELRKERYARQLEMGIINPSWALSPRPDDVMAWESLTAEQKEKEDLKMAVFAAMVDRLDQNIGRLMAKIETMGKTKNTLFMFMSDNGGCPFERSSKTEIPPWEGGGHLTYHAAWAGASNTPFRWFKQNNHEGGISSPMIVHWPAVISAGGRLANDVGHLVDIVPTCLAAAGAAAEANSDVGKTLPLRGISLVPVFQGEKLEPRTAYWQFSQNRAIRVGDWKLVSAVGGPWELYDMKADRTELHDMSSSQPDRVATMTAAWEGWAKQPAAPAKKKKNAVKKK